MVTYEKEYAGTSFSEALAVLRGQRSCGAGAAGGLCGAVETGP